MPGFEISFLDDYTDEALLDEVRRVAALLVWGFQPAKAHENIPEMVAR